MQSYFTHLDFCESSWALEISSTEMPASSFIELDGTLLVVLKVPKNTFWKTQQQCLFAKIMTFNLLKIIHRLGCEQFHVGTIFSLTKLHSTT